jgi:hypothetical protein
MTVRVTRHVLAGILLAAFVACVVGVAYGYWERQFFEEDFRSLIVKIVGQYAGPVSIVGAAYFATRDSISGKRVGGSGAIAIVFTGLWCSFTAGRTVLFILSSDETVDVLTNLECRRCTDHRISDRRSSSVLLRINGTDGRSDSGYKIVLKYPCEPLKAPQAPCCRISRHGPTRFL